MSLISTMLESSCLFQNPTTGQDDAKGLTVDPYVTYIDGLACSYQEPGSSVVPMYAQRNTVLQPTVFLAQDPECEVNDRCVVTLSDGSQVYLNVEGEAVPVARFVLWQVACQRIRQPELRGT